MEYKGFSWSEHVELMNHIAIKLQSLVTIGVVKMRVDQTELTKLTIEFCNGNVCTYNGSDEIHFIHNYLMNKK